MPTRKEILQTKINTDLATGTNITASEHRGVESAIMNATIPANRGFFQTLDVQGTSVGTNLTCFGDITAATVIQSANVSSVSVYVATSMLNTNYMVRIHIQSIGTDNNQDATILCPTFITVSPTNFYINIKEPTGASQNLRFHLEVVSLDY
jgi:hypothetical protein